MVSAMKKTRQLVLIRNIWATKVSFFSIALFVALGIGVFLGLRWNGPAFHNTADQYYEEHLFHDVAVSYPYGITDDDVADIEALDGVMLVEGGYTAEGTVRIGTDSYVVAVQSLTEKLDLAAVQEGVLPQAPDEVGIERRMAGELGLRVGDVLAIRSERAGRDSLNNTEFKITAIVDHPAYINMHASYSRGITSIGNGAVSYYVLMSEQAFQKPAYEDAYSNVYVRFAGLRGMNSFENGYRIRAEALAAGLKELGEGKTAARYELIRDRYQAEIDEARRDLEKGSEQISSGEEEIAGKEEELKAAEEQITDGRRQIGLAEEMIRAKEQLLAEGEAAYAEGQRRFREGAARLEEALERFQEQRRIQQTRLNDSLRQLGQTSPETYDLVCAALDQSRLPKDGNGNYQISSDPATAKTQVDTINRALGTAVARLVPETEENRPARTSLTSARSSLTQTSGQLDEYLAGKAELDRSEAELRQADADIRAGRQELDDAKAQLEDQKAFLEESQTKLEDARIEFESGKAQLESGKTELEDGRARLEKAEKAFAQLMEIKSWILEKRTDNVSYNVAKTYSETGDRTCWSIALLFVFVGIMICYTSISRIVMEQQVMTGVEKAMGFTEIEIVWHYMQYAILAVLLGGALGGVLGYFLIERLMNSTLAATFTVGTFAGYFSWRDLLVISAAELVLICLSAWLACRRQLARRAIDLLKGNSQSARKVHFYERSGWYQRSSLYTQMIINNLVNDRNRVIATLVGIVGCTSLVIMALTFRADLQKTPEKHFANVNLYEQRLVSDESVDNAMENLSAALDEAGVSYARVYQKNLFIMDEDDKPHSVDVIVIEQPEQFGPYIQFRDARGKRAMDLPDNGVLLNYNYTKYHDAAAGGAIQVMDTQGSRHDFTVAGVMEHYLSANQIFMTPSYYSQVIGEEVRPNTFYINLNGADAGALKEKLSGIEGYFSMTDDHARWVTVFATFQSTTSLVIAIALFLSAMMSLLVLLNLNVVLINERARELIIMRINGFSMRDTKRYVYRDNIVLTILGILLGVAAGMVLSVYVITSVSSENSTILTDQSLLGCLGGMGITALFALATNLIALRRVDKLKVSDLNKM